MRSHFLALVCDEQADYHNLGYTDNAVGETTMVLRAEPRFKELVKVGLPLRCLSAAICTPLGVPCL
jgi:hypothetical protein